MHRMITSSLALRKKQFNLTLFLLLMVPLGSLGIDVYVPAMPEMQHLIGLSNSVIKMSIPAYLFGIAIGQAIFGEFVNKYKAKRIIIINLFLYSMLTIFVHQVMINAGLLLFGRFVQGFFISVTVVAPKAIMAVYYEHVEMKKVSAYITIIWSVSIIFAPIVGSFLERHFDWTACFKFLGVYALLVMTFGLFTEIKSFCEKDRVIFGIISNYRLCLRNKKFLIYSLLRTLSFSYVIIFSLLGPFIVRQDFHFSILYFGLVAIFSGCGYLIGGLIFYFYGQTLLLGRKNLIQKFLGYQLIVNIILLYIAKYTFSEFILVTSINMIMSGVLFSYFTVAAMSCLKHIPGTASAFLGISLSMLTATMTFIVSCIHLNDLIICYIFYFLICLSGFFISLRIRDVYYDSKTKYS